MEAFKTKKSVTPLKTTQLYLNMAIIQNLNNPKICDQVCLIFLTSFPITNAGVIPVQVQFIADPSDFSPPIIELEKCSSWITFSLFHNTSY